MRPPWRALQHLADFRTRIAMAVVSIAVVVAVVLTLIAIVRDSRSVKQSLLTTGQQLAANLARDAVVSVLAGDRDQTRRLARGLFDVPDVAQVLVYQDGELFVRVERGSASAAPPPPPQAPPEQVVLRHLRVGGRPALSFLVPIVLEPSTGEAPFYRAPQPRQTIGVAEVVLSLERASAALRAMIFWNASILLLAVGFAQLASMLVSQRIARPLRRLTAAAERIGTGELDVTLPVESGDEIGRLSDTFNRMAADLRQLDESKTKFLAVISHELRTPLVPIRGYLHLARSGQLGTVPQGLKKSLEVMERNAIQLTDRVERLLLFSVIASGELPVSHEPCDLRTVLTDAIERARPRLVDEGHPLDIAVADEPMLVLGDAARLGQVYDNLLSNAAKFSPPGKPVRVRARLIGALVVVEVSDEGIGIPQELHDKIFERFYQVPRVLTRQYPGVGLGLAIAKELVTRHGGSISVSSRPGEGSTFRTELPLLTKK